VTRVAVVVDGNPSASAELDLAPGINVATGERACTSYFGTLTSLELDLLTVASAVYCSDLAVKRGEREQIARSIKISIPVVNLALFRSVREPIVYALYRLSHDAWDLKFVQREGVPETSKAFPSTPFTKVLLFSGGLDSLAGAIRFGESSEQVALVSHITANQIVASSQQNLMSYLTAQFAGAFQHFYFRVGGRNNRPRGFPFPSDRDREETQRTRSFLFLALGAIVARRLGVHEVVVVAENGLMAIHLPLTTARIGAFSTQTAHPAYLNVAADLFSALLQHTIRIDNPFLYDTKGEVIARTMAAHRSALERSVSCWKASRVAGVKRHCGFCVPCVLRRISVETQGVELDEYQRDLFREDLSGIDPDDIGKKNVVELAELVRTFTTRLSQSEYEDLYPDLISRDFDAPRTVDMYCRFAAECQGVITNYPLLRGIFG
jgi:7-cyano-7-deazaguanine synthase in queuosine biosynthesis